MAKKQKPNSFKKRFMAVFAEMSDNFPHLTRDAVVEVAIQAVLTSPEDDVLINIMRARHPLAAENYAEALPYLQKAYTADPKNNNVRADLAHCLFETSHYAEAAPHLAQLLKKWPTDHTLVFMHAYALFKTGDSRSIKLLEKSLTFYDDLIDLYPAQLKDVMQMGLRAMREKGMPYTPK